MKDSEPNNQQEEQERAAKRRYDFYSAVINQSPLNDLSVEAVQILQPGDSFDYHVPARSETLVITATYTTPEKAAALIQNGFFGALAAGLVAENTTENYHAFSQRPIITVYSEPHNGHTFAYDVQTGKRFWPRNPQGTRRYSTFS